MTAKTNLRWYVVRTNIKCEDRAAASLRAAGFHAYLPKMRKDIIHHRTKKKVEKSYALFRRYLFVSVPLSDPDWFAVRSCDGVESVVGVNGTPIAVPGYHIDQFMTAERNMDFDETERAKIHRGELKRTAKERFEDAYPVGGGIIVRDGFFRGFSGRVTGVRGMKFVEAMVSFLGGLVPVEFPVEDIEPSDIDCQSEAA